MRVKTALDPDNAAELAEFSEFLLQIGEGRYPVNRDIDDNDICIPQSMCVTPVSGGSSTSIQNSSGDDSAYEAPNFNLLQPLDPEGERESDEPEDDQRTRSINALIGAIYPGVGDADLPNQYFVDRAILAPTNASVRRINEMIAERLSGETREYLSNDSLDGPGAQNLFETEVLNSLNFSGLPLTRWFSKLALLSL
ncbi:hypothetical protein AM588_10011484 [Phytophthora nicotianae]|uniref:Uncharacterized protein n=1 Tax=Phytophthora nicotianae TaxID=4792 RepID=A0A0W8DN43_PHYNI|nr:hypothetical protein AM588_10011484 [Phytophthora nicotianae]